MVIVQAHKNDATYVDLRVRRAKVLAALHYLNANNRFYSDIEIDGAALAQLPEDDNLQLPVLEGGEELQQMLQDEPGPAVPAVHHDGPAMSQAAQPDDVVPQADGHRPLVLRTSHVVLAPQLGYAAVQQRVQDTVQHLRREFDRGANRMLHRQAVTGPPVCEMRTNALRLWTMALPDLLGRARGDPMVQDNIVPETYTPPRLADVYHDCANQAAGRNRQLPCAKSCARSIFS